MLQGWAVLGTALVYLLALFAVASYGDRRPFGAKAAGRPNIYALSLAIYCTTWTFFGSVGLAVSGGVNFFAIYLGPILLFTLGYPLVARIVRLSKEERITSVADFLGARYGKSQRVAGFAAIIALVATVPYIALQLKAVSTSVLTLIFHYSLVDDGGFLSMGEISLLIALTLAVFAILFGTRHADATEHQDGLMLAVAVESVVKFFAFLFVGLFTVYFMFDGFGDLYSRAAENPEVRAIVARGFDAGGFALLTFLSFIVFLMLPRQFHVAVVENHSQGDLRRARLLFPAYLIGINLFVIPIAIAGLLKFGSSVAADDFVLLLPTAHGNDLVAMITFLGGLSAGAAMVVVACVAVSIMISNDLVLPFILSRQAAGPSQTASWAVGSMEQPILNIRRTAIVVLLVLAYAYVRFADNSRALASIGLVSFAAIAQLAPAFFGGLFWSGATGRGAIAGMAAGFAVWAYTLLMPTLIGADHWLIATGLHSSGILRPESIFGLPLSPIANGVIWSLAMNTVAFVIGSVSRLPTTSESAQSAVFVSRSEPLLGRRDSVRLTVRELQQAVGRYLGEKRTGRAFEAHIAESGKRLHASDTVSPSLLRFSEQLLASAIGASSSRLVHTLLLRRYEHTTPVSRQLLDQASEALKFNRDILQTALDQMDQAVTVFDADYRLAFWNRQFRKLLGLSASLGAAGTPLAEIVAEIIAVHKLTGPETSAKALRDRIVKRSQPWLLALSAVEKIVEVRTSSMPGGGIVVTWHDITERILVSEALREANESLEKRVAERTGELVSANRAMQLAHRAADQANASKTRFLAAAGHDILQPLNAAKLYAATLSERLRSQKNGVIVDNIGRALDSVEEILGAVLAISRLDTGRQEVKIVQFSLNELFEQLAIEFEPIAKDRGLAIRFAKTSQFTRSDPALLRRVLQNLISNAIRYTRDGKVLVGCRRRGAEIRLDVADTGIGIAENNHEAIFAEFCRLEDGKKQAPGLGLGLSIVERIAKTLDHRVEFESQVGRGTRFSVWVPVATGGQLTVLRPRPSKAAGGIANLSGLRVLCVDNEPDIVDGMVKLLRQWKCRVRTATNRKSAMAMLRKTSTAPDVLLVDYHLGDGTGLEVIDKARDRLSGSVRYALVTADRSPQLKSEAERRDVAILYKPVKAGALRALLAAGKPLREAAE